MQKIQIESLAPTCPIDTRYVGETLTLSSNPTTGTPPYSYTFWAIQPGTTTQTILGTQNQTTNNIMYTLSSSDVTTTGGSKLELGVDIYDSCPSGSRFSTESCIINVAAPSCVQPTVTFNIT